MNTFRNVLAIHRWDAPVVVPVAAGSLLENLICVFSAHFFDSPLILCIGLSEDLVFSPILVGRNTCSVKLSELGASRRFGQGIIAGFFNIFEKTQAQKNSTAQKNSIIFQAKTQQTAVAIVVTRISKLILFSAILL